MAVLDKTHLTATEMGKLWATYVSNTMADCVLSHYLKHVDDSGIRKILSFALDLCRNIIGDIKNFFAQADFPLPVGFTDQDVNLEAPRLFEDEFYLHYLNYSGKAGLSIYSVAIPLVTRKDIRDFYSRLLHETVKLMSAVNDALLQRGSSMNAPIIPPPPGVRFVQSQSFLDGFFGDVRPLHGLEIAHLTGNIHNDITSKALVMGFHQGARLEKVKKYLERGKELNQKHIDQLSDKLNKSHLPAPPLIDHLVTPSTIPPFSDKLMLFHKIDMFSMKVREYANGASLNGRKDIGALFAKCQLDVALYVEDGANIMIEQGWMEKPPEAIDRGNL